MIISATADLMCVLQSGRQQQDMGKLYVLACWIIVNKRQYVSKLEKVQKFAPGSSREWQIFCQFFLFFFNLSWKYFFLPTLSLYHFAICV